MTMKHGRSLSRRGADVLACVFGRGWPGDAAVVIDAVTAGAGLPGEDVETALTQLLNACRMEAELSVLGRLGLRWDVLRLLRNLVRLRAEEAGAPEILEERIEAPLIITGLPRSGSTFLHRLLTADPQAAAPLCWQTIYPYPDPRARRDRRARRVERQLRGFNWLAPALRSVHPLDSSSPQECTEITAHMFRSLRFETVYNVPGYKAWLQSVGHDAAYRFHRRFLQHLQHQGSGSRWVLKCPDHVFALGALREVYPDARIVFLHRDPLKVLPSVAHLTEILRAPFTRRLDRQAIGRTVLEDWARGAALMVREARSPTFPPAQVLHLRYRDVVQRPIETVQRLYRHFGLTLEAPALAAMQRLLASRPRGGYGENHYSFTTHGIDPDELRARFDEYAGLFGVPPEGEPPAPARGVRTRPAHAGS
jgi:hypothetical protein